METSVIFGRKEVLQRFKSQQSRRSNLIASSYIEGTSYQFSNIDYVVIYKIVISSFREPKFFINFSKSLRSTKRKIKNLSDS